MRRNKSDNGMIPRSKIALAAQQTKFESAMLNLGNNMKSDFVNSYTNGFKNEMKPVVVSNSITMPAFTPDGAK